MKEINEKKNKAIASIVATTMGLGILVALHNLFHTGTDSSSFTRDLVIVINYLCIFYYIVAGYKVPHGNMLKHIMIIYALSIAINSVTVFYRSLYTWLGIYGFLQLFIALLVTYIAGRLHKIKENIVYAVIIGVMLLAGIVICAFSTSAGYLDKLYNAVLTVQWLVIVQTYYVRYKVHKEAGLEDKALVK